MCEHRIHDVRLADCGHVAGHPVPRGDRRRHAARRAVHDDRPRRLREHGLDAQRERRLLADVPSVGRGDRQPVGIGILKKSDIRVLLPDLRQHRGEVFGRRLGRMLEQAVGLPSRDRELAAEVLEEQPCAAAAGAMPRVEPDPRSAAADRLDIDGRRDEPDMRRAAIDVSHAAAHRAGGFHTVGKRVKPGEHVRPVGSREHAARRREELEAVVLRRVMARGNLDATGGPLLTHDDTDRRRGGDAAVDHIATAGHEKLAQGCREQRPVRAAVAADHNRPGRQGSCERGRVARCHVGCERRSHDAAQPRNAHDQGVGHCGRGV